MKRSEMLLKIAKQLHKKAIELADYVADPDFESFRDAWMEDADEVLALVEKAGMLPPPVTEKSVMPGLSDFTTNEWEDE